MAEIITSNDNNSNPSMVNVFDNVRSKLYLELVRWEVQKLKVGKLDD